MAKMAPPNQDLKICEAALRLAAERDWENVRLEQIAKLAKVPAASLKARFESVNAILPLIVEQMTEEAFSACGKPDRKSPPHDRLFEAMMARFDCLQDRRKAILSIAAYVRHEPRAALILVPSQIAAMRETLIFTGFNLVKANFLLSPLALWAAHVATFRVWQKDETLDMSKTMAALDRYLRYAGRAATLLRGNFI